MKTLRIDIVSDVVCPWCVPGWQGDHQRVLPDRFGDDAITDVPDGHPKLPHFWPGKLLQAGRPDYDDSVLMAMRAAASLSR